MNRFSFVCVVGFASAACGGDSVAECGELSPCGGDVVGTWSFVDSCITSVPDQGCGVTLTADNSQTTGTITINADGTYSQNSATTGSVVSNVPAGCLNAGVTSCAMINAADITCSGDVAVACECTIDVAGTDNTPGTYSLAGNAITVDTDPPAQYCVSGNSLSVQTSDQGFVGETILEKM